MSMRLGILGATRGLEFAFAARKCSLDVEIAAICENYPPLLEKLKVELPASGLHPRLYTDYGEMISSAGLDGVIIANDATGHAKFAIDALRHGVNVLSEVLPAQTMAEAVALVEAVEASGKRYSYAENYCYFAANFQIARRYREGEIGEIIEGESDFINDCSQRWHLLTRGLRGHWRNHVPATFYCTHSLAPLFFATRRRPIRVTGFEITAQDYLVSHGARNGSAAIEMVELDNGAVLKSLHGNLKRPWVTRLQLHGTKGSLESRDMRNYMSFVENNRGSGYDDFDVREGAFHDVPGIPSAVVNSPEAFIIYNFIGAASGDKTALDFGIDIYQTLDMFLPGLFAYRSILAGGVPMEIPDLRDGNARDAYRHDCKCTDARIAAGTDLLPSYSRGEIKIDDSVYIREAALYTASLESDFHLGMN